MERGRLPDWTWATGPAVEFGVCGSARLNVDPAYDQKSASLGVAVIFSAVTAVAWVAGRMIALSLRRVRRGPRSSDHTGAVP